MIAELFMTDVGRDMSRALDKPEDWDAVVLPMADLVYEIAHRPTGTLMWVANDEFGFDFAKAKWPARILNWADRRVCWPKAKRIRDVPAVECHTDLVAKFVRRGHVPPRPIPAPAPMVRRNGSEC